MKGDLTERDKATAAAIFESKRTTRTYGAYDRCECGTARGAMCRNGARWALIGGRWPGIFCKMHGEHMRASYGGRLVKP